MVTITMFLLVYVALLFGQIPSSFAAPEAHIEGIQTTTRSSTLTVGAPSPKSVETVTVHDTPAPSPKTVIKVEQPVNSASPPAGTKTVIKSTKTPIDLTEDYSTRYPWDQNGLKRKIEIRDVGIQEIEVPSGWTPPAGFPTSFPDGRIGKKEERDVESANIYTSYRTFTVIPPPVAAPPPPPPPPSQPQAPQLLPGQIPTTRSDIDNIVVKQGEWEPADIKQLHIFGWDADHPELVAIGGKYANMVSTLVKSTPPPPPPSAAPQSQQQQQQQPSAQQQQQQGVPHGTYTIGTTTVQTFETVVTKVRTWTSTIVIPDATSISVSEAAQPAPAPSMLTSLITIPAGQLGGLNKEPTVVSVLVPVEKPSAAAAAPAPPPPPPPPAAPQVISTSYRILSLVHNTPAAASAPAATTPAQAEKAPSSNSASASVNEQWASVSQGSQTQAQAQAQASPKVQEEKKGDNVWGTVVPGQDVVVGGKTMEVMTVMAGGP